MDYVIENKDSLNTDTAYIMIAASNLINEYNYAHRGDLESKIETALPYAYTYLYKLDTNEIEYYMDLYNVLDEASINNESVYTRLKWLVDTIKILEDSVVNDNNLDSIKKKNLLCSKKLKSVRSFVFAFNVVNKRFINHFVTSWSRIVTCKIPVSGIFRTCHMKVFNCLINYLHFGPHTFRF